MSEEEESTSAEESGIEDSSSRNSVLSLRYSSSPFIDRGSSSDSDESSRRVEPYLYELEDSDSPSHSSGEGSSVDENRQERLDNTDW